MAPVTSFLSTTTSLEPVAVSKECRFFWRIRDTAVGPPITQPATSPKVAEAMATALAPETPAFSRSGPKEAAVPWPPTMGMEPVASPSRGSRPKALAMKAPRPFWSTHIITAIPKNSRTWSPPFFRRRKQAVKPTLQKNTTIKKVWSVESKEISRIPAWRRARWARAKTTPPATGSGIQ